MAYNEKLNRYFKRTMEHIHRVHNNMVYLVTECADTLKLNQEDCRQCIWNVINHDRSKFNETQFLPYIELTEYYHQRKTLRNKKYEYPTEEIKKAVDEAVQDHYARENHHPEKYKNNNHSFTKLECIEIICDLQAMAQEFKEGSCRKFFEEIWRPKHTNFQTDDCIYWESLALMRIVIKCFERNIENNES